MTRAAHQALTVSRADCQFVLYLLPQQALYDFPVAGHFVLRPTC